MEDKSLDMTVTLPYSLEAGGSRRIPLPLRGTIDKPELDLQLQPWASASALYLFANMSPET